MKSDKTATIDEERFISTTEQLEALLRQQLTLAQKGNIAEMEELAKKANVLVEQISGLKFLKEPKFKQRCRELEQLYNDLFLTLSSQMNEVSQSLGKIYKGKKTVTLYRDNV
jgi:hypothetical protein